MYMESSPAFQETPDRQRKRYRDDRYQQSGNYGRRRDDRGYGRSMRPSPEDEAREKLKSSFVSVGISQIEITLKQDIERLVTTTETEWEQRKETVLELLTVCVRELPMKTPIYGTFTALLNSRNLEIATAVIEHFGGQAQKALDMYDWTAVKIYLRLMAELTNSKVFEAQNFIQLLQKFSNAAANEENVPQTRSDTFVRLVLATLPYVGLELHSNARDDLENLMNTLEGYMYRRPPLDITIFKVYPGDDAPYDQRDTLELLWKQTQSMQIASWEAPDLLKPHKAFDFSTQQKHQVPDLSISSHQESTKYYPLRYNFILRANDTFCLPGVESISQFLIEDVIRDTIESFEVNRKEAARYVNQLRYYFADGTFTPQSSQDRNGSNFNAITNDDGSINAHPTQPHYSLEDMVIEVLFGEMFVLPDSTFANVYYHVLIMELCKTNPVAIAPSLGRAVHCLYDRIEKMDHECIHRFSEFFSLHLSNFNFAWNWAQWAPALECDVLNEKHVFIREVLAKELSLSYFERIRQSIPENMYSAFMDGAPTTNFAYELPNHPLNQAAVEYQKVLKARGDDAAVAIASQELDKALPDLTDVQKEDVRRDVLTQCVLMLGSKSFSHMLNIIERNLNILQSVNGSSPRSRRHTIYIVAEFWKDNVQFMTILIDKLLNYRLVDPIAIISWLLGIDHKDEFTIVRAPIEDPSKGVAPRTLEIVPLITTGYEISRSYIWDILTIVTNKVNSQVGTKLEKSDENGIQDDNGTKEDEGNDFVTSQVDLYRTIVDRLVELIESDERDEWKHWAYGILNDFLRRFRMHLPDVVIDDAKTPALKDIRKMREMKL